MHRGSVANNTNQYQVLIAKLENGEWSHPEPLFSLASSSNRPAVENISWCSDSDSFLFLGENPGETHQLYRYSVSQRTIRRASQHVTNVLRFGATADCRKVALIADRSSEQLFGPQERMQGLPISTQFIFDLVRSQTSQASSAGFDTVDADLLILDTASSHEPRFITTVPGWSGTPTLSPNAQFVAIPMPQSGNFDYWRDYEWPYLRTLLADGPPGGRSPLWSLHLIDVSSGETSLLLNAPFVGDGLLWSNRSDALYVSSTYLPLLGAERAERARRRSHTFVAEVSVPEGRVRPICQGGGTPLRAAEARNLIVGSSNCGGSDTVSTLRYERRGSEWRLVERVTGPISPQRRERFDTSPQLVVRDQLERENVLIDLDDWNDMAGLIRPQELQVRTPQGAVIPVGVYYPRDFRVGRRYPVVVQTHGWNSATFHLDGPRGMTSGYAAQALASSGIIVLQVQDHTESDNPDINSPAEVTQALAAYEAAIAHLDEMGAVDLDRIGILGFSATCAFVKHALQSSQYRFAAASIIEGFDDGYFQYVLFQNQVSVARIFEGRNAGMPYGSGLRTWLERSPSFSMDEVTTPVRLVALNPLGVLAEWEWFGALSRLDRPVDFVAIEDGVHNLVRPRDRMIASDQNVDWFRFWLQGYEDPDPAKREQYVRWRALRESQDGSTGLQ